MQIAIFGTGGMGREVADLLIRQGRTDFAFVVDEPHGPVDGIPVKSPQELDGTESLILALGNSDDRRAVASRFSAMQFGRVISECARVSPHATIGPGGVICDFVVVNNGSRIGRHFQANCYAQISHDCVIGDFVTFAPHVSCNGWVEIGNQVFVGAGAVIRNGLSGARLKIGDGAVIGMGAVVTSDVPPRAVVIGNPAGAIR